MTDILLRPYHFHKPEEPKNDLKALQDYKAKFEDPEYDKYNYHDKGPAKNQNIYGFFGSTITGFIYNHHNLAIMESNYGSMDSWCDKESHDKKVQIYNENRVLFEGWCPSNKYALDDQEFVNDELGVNVFFRSTGKVSIEKHGYYHYTNKNGVTIFQFESITGLKRNPNV